MRHSSSCLLYPIDFNGFVDYKHVNFQRKFIRNDGDMIEVVEPPPKRMMKLY
jgi:hypothetical protein